MRIKYCSAVAILIVSLLFSCGGGGGGGSGSGSGSGSGGNSSKTVRLSFDISSKDGNISNKALTPNGTNPFPNDVVYCYKATPKWNAKGSKISGATKGFVEFDPATFSDVFALGNWEFEIQVMTNTANRYLLYDTARVDNVIPVVNVNNNTRSVEITVEKKLNGTGTVNVEIYAPTVSLNDKVKFIYGKIGGSEKTVELTGTHITDGVYSNYTEFKGTLINVPAGLYLFRAVYSYIDENNNYIEVENDDIVFCELFGDGSVGITGTIEGSQDTNVVVAFTINGFHALGVTVKAVASETDDTEVTDLTITPGESRVFKAIPSTGSAGSEWITYIEPDTYQWYVNGEAVATGQYFTFSTTASTAPNTTYVYCLASKSNENNVVEYAAGAGKVVIVEPN